MSENFPPQNESSNNVFNPTDFIHFDPNNDGSAGEYIDLSNYLKKTGDTMSGSLLTPEMRLYGSGSKIIFNDNTEMTTAINNDSDISNLEQKTTDITYSNGITSITNIDSDIINEVSRTEINNLKNTTSNIQTQFNNITNKTNNITKTNTGDIEIKGNGNSYLQVGNVNDSIDEGGDDGASRIGIGFYTGNNVGISNNNIPSNTSTIAGHIHSNFLIGARGNSADEGLILSGQIYNYNNISTEQGPHMFINKDGKVSIGKNCRTKYTEGYKLLVEGTTKFEDNITLTANKKINNTTTTELSYLEGSNSNIQDQINNISTNNELNEVIEVRENEVIVNKCNSFNDDIIGFYDFSITDNIGFDFSQHTNNGIVSNILNVLPYTSTGGSDKDGVSFISETKDLNSKSNVGGLVPAPSVPGTQNQNFPTSANIDCSDKASLFTIDRKSVV